MDGVAMLATLPGQPDHDAGFARFYGDTLAVQLADQTIHIFKIDL